MHAWLSDTLVGVASGLPGPVADAVSQEKPYVSIIMIASIKSSFTSHLRAWQGDIAYLMYGMRLVLDKCPASDLQL